MHNKYTEAALIMKRTYLGIGMYLSFFEFRSVISIYPAVGGGVTSANK